MRLGLLLALAFIAALPSAAASPYYGEGGMMPHSTSPFAIQTAQSMVEAVVLKQKWLNFLTDNPGVRLWFMEDQAHSFWAVQRFQGFYLLILDYAGSAGGNIPHFAVTTASNMYQAVHAKAEVLRFLATDMYPEFADNLAMTFVMKMQFTAKFLKALFQGFH